MNVVARSLTLLVAALAAAGDSSCYGWIFKLRAHKAKVIR